MVTIHVIRSGILVGWIILVVKLKRIKFFFLDVYKGGDKWSLMWL
jgi:hypothetical protein